MKQSSRSSTGKRRVRGARSHRENGALREAALNNGDRGPACNSPCATHQLPRASLHAPYPPSSRSQYKVPIANRQEHVLVDRRLLRRAVKSVLSMAGIGKAAISVAIVDDDTISEFNWKYLRHRGPADVLSFPLDDADGLEGEVIVSAETATRRAPRYGWTPHDELLLYVVHGTLHLVGHDDRTPRQQAEMRQMEKNVLQGLGIARR